jgi:hypothetical protein
MKGANSTNPDCVSLRGVPRSYIDMTGASEGRIG